MYIDKVISLMQEHPDTEYHYRKLGNLLELGDRVDNLSTILAKLAREPKSRIHKGSARGMYYYSLRPKQDAEGNNKTGPQERDLLEVLRVRADGNLVLVDETGNLYVAKIVDV